MFGQLTEEEEERGGERREERGRDPAH